MKHTDALVGPLLQEFFVKHLMTHRNVSPQTLWSYRDAFRLLLRFVAATMHIEPVALNLIHLSPSVILAFLDSLEVEPFILPLGRHIQTRLCRTFHVRAGHPDQTH
jgi:integrase/recombinase XerD